MGKSPAQREKEQRRHARMAALAAAESRQARRKRATAIVVVGLVIALVVSLFAGALVQGLADDSASSDADTTDLTAEPPVSVAPPIDVTLPPPGATLTGATPCPPADGSAERTTAFAAPPPTCIDTALQYRAIVRTSEGDLEFLLHDDQAPTLVNNFVVLARYRFYDGVPFYRIVPRTMLLTGDATGDPVGEGGPGYTLDDEIPEAGAIYPPGTLAMWTDRPDQNGSRFLIAAGEEAAGLPPEYTPIGLLLDGTDTVNAIQVNGDPFSGNPIGEVTIESVEIIEEPDPSGAGGDAPGSTAAG